MPQVRKNEHDLYPIEPNGIELMLAGMASAMALFTPRKGLNPYDNSVRYMSLSSVVLFGYYAILAFVDIYCFRIPDRKRTSLSLSERVTKVVLLAVQTALAACVLSVISILFGAPVLSQWTETFLGSLNVALLGVTPGLLTIKLDLSSWRRALLSSDGRTIPERWGSGFFWCTMVTSWCFSYFIPMDWDRPWQRWPIPLVGGAYLGNLIGILYVAVRVFIIPMARADFAETEQIKREFTREAEADNRKLMARRAEAKASESKKSQ